MYPKSQSKKCIRCNYRTAIHDYNYCLSCLNYFKIQTANQRENYNKAYYDREQAQLEVIYGKKRQTSKV